MDWGLRLPPPPPRGGALWLRYSTVACPLATTYREPPSLQFLVSSPDDMCTQHSAPSAAGFA